MARYWIFCYSEKDGWEGPEKRDDIEEAKKYAVDMLSLGYTKVVILQWMIQFTREDNEDY